MNETEFNPYAPPLAAKLTPDPTQETIRRAHIGHETSVKSIGGLYALVGGLMLLVFFIGLLESLLRSSWDNDFTEQAIRLLIGVGALLLGAGVRRLRPWARIAMAVVSGLLAAVTLLTVFFSVLNLFVIWLMLSAKGRMVFSPAYQQIIAFTPDVKPRTSGVVWLLLCVVIFFVIAVLAALLIPAFR